MNVAAPMSRAPGQHRGSMRWPARVLAPVLMAALALLVGAAPPGWAVATADEVHYTFTGPTSVAIDWRGTASDVRWGTTTS